MSPFVAAKLRRLFVITASLAPLAHRLPAQSSSSLAGDLFVVTENGDTKKGAGLTVALLPYRAMFRVPAIAICDDLDAKRLAARRRSDSLGIEFERAIKAKKIKEAETINDERFSRDPLVEHMRDADGRLSSLFDSMMIARTGTGINAHFRFDSLAAGEYTLFARWTIQGMPYSWFVPVNVRNSAQETQDLDNSVESISMGTSFLTRVCAIVRKGS